jgi:hypothetical protein
MNFSEIYCWNMAGSLHSSDVRRFGSSDWLSGLFSFTFASINRLAYLMPNPLQFYLHSPNDIAMNFSEIYCWNMAGSQPT